jgi:hypothetical protein
MMPRLTCLLAALLVLAAMSAGAPVSAAPQPNNTAIANQWWRRAETFQSERYNIRSDMPRELARELAAHMDSVVDHYGELLAGLRVRRALRFELLLFEDQKDYLATIDSRFDAEVHGTGGCCIRDRGQVTLAIWHGNHTPAEIKAIMQHEGFHQVARSQLGDIPYWADEGFAQLCEAAILLDGKLLFGDVPAPWLATLRQADQRGALLPLQELFKADGEDWNEAVNEGRAGLMYLQAWSFIQYLRHVRGDGRGREFERFLAELNTGMSWESAFLRAFGTNDFKAVQREWLTALRAMQPTDLRETIRRLDFLAAGVTALRDGKKHVETLDALKAALQEAAFVHTCKRFEPRKTFKAADDQAFLVPGSSGTEGGTSAATFELVAAPTGDASTDKKPAPVKKRPVRERKPKRGGDAKPAAPEPDAPPQQQPPPIEAAPLPAPPIITTRGLLPFDLQVTWSRDRATGAWSYSIDRR